MARRTNSLPLKDPYPTVVPPRLSLVGGTNSEPQPSNTSMEDGALKIENPDGSVTIDFNPQAPDEGPEEKDEFDRNLAKRMDDDDLGTIGTALLEGVQRDDDSRKEWLSTRAMGIDMLGLKIEKPRSDAGTSSAPLEGMSTVRHPLLLGAVTNFQATARAELLPASGPVKVRNDAPVPPNSVFQGTNAAHALADSMENKDELAQSLEKNMNHYLTAVATEYVPDTDRMLFYVGFGGDGFKKVYNCPLRRRPVSESIDAEDLIISNAATDIRNSGRVTHRIKMRQSTLKRMQILGVYREVDLNPPPIPMANAVDQKKEQLAGQTTTNQRPEDRDFEIYESYCELDLDQFAPKNFKGKGLALPYRVTMEKDSRKILDIRRNWKKDDEQCLAKQFFVQFPFIRGLGFYGLGFIHLLGNTTMALTAAWRLILDAGMFGNFPGFLYKDSLGRQKTNQFRVGPATGVPIQVGAQDRLQDSVMALPYKEAGPTFTTFITHVEEVAKQLAGTANISVGEGKQDAPVGTTIALIEQASKVMDSGHKRLHASQTEEFKLIVDRFREDPEALFRHNKKLADKWKLEQFTEALDKYELVPVADPNNPTSLHRIAKAMAIKELQKQSPDLYDPIGVDMRVLHITDIDPSGLFRAQPAPPPPDPRMEAIKEKAAAQQNQVQIQLLETKIKAASEAAKLSDKASDRLSKEKIANMQIELQHLKLQQEQIIHAHDEERDRAKLAHEMGLKQAAASHEIQTKHVSKMAEIQSDAVARHQELKHDAIAQQHEMRGGMIESQHEIERNRQKHEAEMERDRQKHEQGMRHAQEMHEAELAAAKQLAKVKPKAAKKKD